MARTIYVVDQRKDRSEWWVILAAGAILALWKYILVVSVTLAAIWLLYKATLWVGAAKANKREHDLMNAPTQLMTSGMRVWGNPEHYIDYDDGMRDW
jgi:hypothetical protein